MNALQQNLHQIWDQLRSQKASRSDYLDRIQILKLRGISDLQINLQFPVSVLAGANGCGKSTVLFALACAYRGENVSTTFFPAKIFPDFKPSSASWEDISDLADASELIYSLTDNNQPLSMAWKRGKGKWNKSFFGRKKGTQPSRPTYLHTLSKLTNPSEVRSVIQLAQRKFTATEIDASNIAFAQRILGFKYARLRLVNEGKRDLLVAERGEASAESLCIRYSEFHMSAGERAVIRLSMNLSKLENALVLVDEVEAGLHPHVQQLLMLELQRLALRNQLQIVCTTHSPVVLDSVPMEARVFLERVSNNVVRREAYRDIVQKALYGRSQNVLSFLCEDQESEGYIRGIFDYIGPKLDLLQNDIEVGRDTGKNEYPAHLETLARFRKLSDVVFVLDGDGREVKDKLAGLAEKYKQMLQAVCLPGDEPPEIWMWNLLVTKAAVYGQFFGLNTVLFSDKLKQIDSIYSNAADKPSAIAKNKLYSLCEESSKAVHDLFRHAGRTEAEAKTGETYALVNELERMVTDWRTSQS